MLVFITIYYNKIKKNYWCIKQFCCVCDRLQKWQSITDLPLLHIHISDDAFLHWLSYAIWLVLVNEKIESVTEAETWEVLEQWSCCCSHNPKQSCEQVQATMWEDEGHVVHSPPTSEPTMNQIPEVGPTSWLVTEWRCTNKFQWDQQNCPEKPSQNHNLTKLS